MVKKQRERQRLNKIIVGGLRETIRVHGFTQFRLCVLIDGVAVCQ